MSEPRLGEPQCEGGMGAGRGAGGIRPLGREVELSSIPGRLARLSSDRASSKPKGACRLVLQGSGSCAPSLQPVVIGDYQSESETESLTSDHLEVGFRQY